MLRRKKGRCNDDCFADKKETRDDCFREREGKRFGGNFDVGKEGDDDAVIRKKYGPHRDAEGGQVLGVVLIIRGGVEVKVEVEGWVLRRARIFLRKGKRIG